MPDPIHGPEKSYEALRVGRRHSHMATPTQQTAGIHPTCGGSHHQEATELKAIMAVASCLARRGRARLARQSRTMGPKRGCVSNHCSQRALPREKQKADSRTKGVVGNSGKTMPTTPVIRQNNPQSNQTQRCQRGREAMRGRGIMV